ncbi:MAG: discoidin domain-containing protein [bacterium]|nr:discoidin domain-containing protein [bacterium]
MRIFSLTLLCIYLSWSAYAAFSGSASASSGTCDVGPAYAIDGNLATRWSSDWRDNEWWQFSFDHPQPLAGLHIIWENAFAEIYHIRCSDDASNWFTVASVRDGDGGTDVLFFTPITTRHVRILCEQRGTGWGNSIWEVSFIAPESAPRLTASSTHPPTIPTAALDGSPHTLWRAAATQAWLSISFPQPQPLSGIAIHWACSNVTFCCLQLTNSVAWSPLLPWQTTPGALSYLTWPPMTASALRILCATRRTPPAIAEIELLTDATPLSPLRRFTLFARAARPGFFPLWLSRQQEFWTITGSPAHPEEALLGETGAVEPRKNRPALLPILAENSRILTFADLPRAHHLLPPGLPLPSVSWGSPRPLLSVSLAASGNATASWARASYRLANHRNSPASLQLALFVRPLQLNPVWQKGGFAPIYTAAWHLLGPHVALSLNDEVYLICRRTDLAGVHTYLAADDDVPRVLTSPHHLTEQQIISPEGLACAALVFSAKLPPLSSRTYHVWFPLQTETNMLLPPPPPPGRTLAAHWQTLTHPRALSFPDKTLNAFIRANLAYIHLTHDRALFKPGPRNYNHAWMRDGALTSLALLRYGQPEPVRAFLLAYTNFIAPNGWVPFLILENNTPAGLSTNLHGGEGQEYDSQGQFIATVYNYFAYTRDQALARALYPTVRAAADFIRALRRARMTDPYRTNATLRPYYGILPHSNSHEGYFPARHSYWDDFWAIRGLHDAATLASLLGYTNDAAWLRAEAADLRHCVLASLTSVMTRAGLTTIPGCVELADFDPTSTSIALTACDLADFLPLPALTNTFARYRQIITPRIEHATPDGFTPYEARNAEVFVRLGQREHALALLRHLITHSTRPPHWLHLAEVVHADPRKPAYIGDMPHTWVAADVLNALRSLVAYEQRHQLVLGAGLDPLWLQHGLAFTNVPTPFGHVSYLARLHNRKLSLRVWGTAAPPAGFVFVPPSTSLLLRFSTIPTNIVSNL